MNDYTRVRFVVTPNEEAATDVLAALLAEVGFESFVNEDDGMSAYVPQALYDAESIAAVVAGFPLPGFAITYQSELIEGEDWNAEWEKNYFQAMCQMLQFDRLWLERLHIPNVCCGPYKFGLGVLDALTILLPVTLFRGHCCRSDAGDSDGC